MGSYYDHDRTYHSGSGAHSGGGPVERRQQEIVSANQVYAMSQRPPRQRSPDLYPPPHRPKSGGGFGCLGDPEMKRRRRVASYKAYTVESKFKTSIRRGIRWIKGKCSKLVHGW